MGASGDGERATFSPYCILTLSATSSPYLAASNDRTYLWMPWASSGVAVSPVPIAHTC